ncbi:MAG: 4Fe-4S dicluster domain-containing protein [Xanthomonadaceae bacterium]|nr:4Fe-4S dicluster domain-containing protein [Rhodospirillaceae bacterium]NIA18050.1 4Fe-4S dicluster domain-containing protein [Xanthomonadaceae bacterium]
MFHISKNKCVGCGLCEEKCPAKAISINNQGFAFIDQEKCIQCGLCVDICPQGASKNITEKLTFAIGTDDGKIIKQGEHIGESEYFSIWDYSEGKMAFREKRENIKYEEDETSSHGNPEKAKKVSSVLTGVDVIAGKIIGPNVVRMKKKYVPVIIREPSIDRVIEIIKENINEIVDEYHKQDRKAIILN